MLQPETAETYYLAVWFVGHNDALPVHKRTDWMAKVYRNSPQADWQVSHRIRVHGGKSVRDTSQDHKYWRDLTLPANLPEATVVEIVTSFAESVGQHNQQPVHTVWVGGDGDKLLACLRTQPWAHFRTEKEPS